ncbi:hypothetical protein AX17_000155 [Amanita inopinata Kibby_2008]|nr:hypothetical protein AX17_000155 [Amanita inopinata Kibby_2008]
MQQNNIPGALFAALNNPYPQHSSHYAHALARASYPATTTDGYSLSSTYNPAPGSQPHPLTLSRQSSNHRFPPRPQQAISWYQSGNQRCSYHGCTFIGARKSVEIHMMDRHLIYPPGWEKHKKKPEWDADPSLKGKQVTIQGTNLVLDTPEALEAWIAERRKRWPTADRVTEKKRKLAEAIERGQIVPDDSSFMRKRRRLDEPRQVDSNEAHRRSGNMRVESGWKGRGRTGKVVSTASLIKGGARTNDARESSQNSCTHMGRVDFEPGAQSQETCDDDGPPEIASSRSVPTDVKPATVSKENLLNLGNGRLKSEGPRCIAQKSTFNVGKSAKRAYMPKKPPYNPFASRPTLMRNLLLPEIRMTISNLSQAIRFLVDNDFLRDVELTPGESENKLVQVLDHPITD